MTDRQRTSRRRHTASSRVAVQRPDTGLDARAAAVTAARTAPPAAPEERDPFDEPPTPLRVIGHGPAHPAGQAARSFGRQLRAWREAHGLSQQVMGERLGWEQPHVARLEAGAHTPSLATIDRLARRLGLTIEMVATPTGTSFLVRDEAA